jgi:hypothetical protein
MDKSLLFPETTKFIGSVYERRVSHLRSKISAFAYAKIKLEITFAWEFDEKDYQLKDSCTCSLRHAFMLPCRHLIPRQAIPVPFSMIGRRWIICDEVLQQLADNEIGKYLLVCGMRY